MIRAIDFQKVEMSDEEFKYYQELVKKLTTAETKGSDYFRDLFNTDDNGLITIIKPSKPVPWDVMFFVQNLLFNQHLRSYDVRIKEIENKVIGVK